MRLGDRTYAVKETVEEIAFREYRLLRDLQRIGLPAVVPQGVVTGRVDDDGEELPAALLTEHLRFSLPYRSLFSHGLSPPTTCRRWSTRWWCCWCGCTSPTSSGATCRCPTCCSGAAPAASRRTSSTRRPASCAQPVRADAGVRPHDRAPRTSSPSCSTCRPASRSSYEVEAHEIVELLAERYHALWDELTAEEEFSADEMWRIEQRIERLNDLGFDVDELDIVTDFDGDQVRIQPKVVELGHHQRELQALTGLHVEDAQARRLLNDIASFTAAFDLGREDRHLVANRWLDEIYEPIMAMIPAEARGKLEPAEIFHEVLVHRWYLSERAGHEVDIFDTAARLHRHRAQAQAGRGDHLGTPAAVRGR